ncbi:MAG: carbohydrate binding family 9 domain-containing protein, partial [Myxococcales bacterium]|nr:carbohydrate binding family 9 domain-containing protein [Myxococcales bacterium]
MLRAAFIAALAVAAAGATPAVAQTSSDRVPASPPAFVPSVKPSLDVSRAPGPIAVDGQLDDPGWAGAARATNFAENFPRERARPSVSSEVWVTYDHDNLYLAFLAFDDPSGIRASLRDRDEMWSDDYFGILLDTYGDAAWAYFLFANPLGVQGDSRFATQGGEDDGFDIIYHSEGMVTDSGYQIEMAIPFASLRFPNRGEQAWRATFWRTRPRASREQHTWAAIDRDEACFLCQLGTLRGIRGVKPGGKLELLPSAVASQAGVRSDADDPASAFANDKVTGALGLNLRYAFSGGLTAEAAVNPDFSQVESDVAQIDVNTTFALFFPERRPFFQEGSDLFESYFNVLYTRQINDPQVATKLVGRMGRSTIAYLGARDANSPVLLPFEERSFLGQAGKSISNIVRFRQTLYEDAYVGAMVTDRRLEDGGSGSVAGIDGQFRFLGKYKLEYQFLGSWTREPNDTALTPGLNGLDFGRGAHTAAFDGESFTGFAQYTSFERSARTWSFDFDYWSSSPTFRADNGFESRNDFRRVSMWQGLTFWPNTKLIKRFAPGLFARRDWNYDGVGKRWLIEPHFSADLTAQTFVNAWYDFGGERFADVDFDDIQRWGAFVQSRFSEPVTLGGFVSHGESVFRDRANPQLGTGTDVEVFATLRPLTQFNISPSLTYSELHAADGTEFFSGFILRTRANLQFTRQLFVRLVVQYNDFNRRLDVEPLLTYRANPFTMFFIGSSLAYRDYDQPNTLAQTSRQFFTKFQYLLR